MKKKEKYQILADSILELIGGKGNITYLAHCVTRLRFNLKDRSLVKQDQIENIPGVIGVQWQGDQLQIIIGQNVNDAYELICKTNQLDQFLDSQNSETNAKKKFSLNSIIDGISGSIVGIIPLLIGAGMLKVVLLILEMTGILGADSGTYQILGFAGEAAFYFMPVFVGASAAKKFGASEGLGMLMGAILVFPGFVSGVAEGINYSFLGIPVQGISYAYTLFPVIISVYILSKVQRFFAKISPQIIRSFSEPLLTILVMVPLTYILIGPAGAFIGEYFAAGIIWSYDTAGFLAVGILASLLPFVVMTGMHAAFNPYTLQMISTVGYEPIFVPAMIINNINQGIASLVVGLKTKDTNLKATALSCAVTAIIGGVTEPAMYGVNLKFKKPMIGAMIGSLCGGLFAGIMHVYVYAFPGAGGLTAIVAFADKTGKNIIFFCISLLIGSIVTFISTFLLYKEEKVEATNTETEEASLNVS